MSADAPLSPDRGAATAPAVAAQTRMDERLDEIFRLWHRTGHVHPLIHLVRRYRTEERKSEERQ